MSHHYSGPNLAFPGGDARLDFTDLYAFPKPGDPGKSILIMNAHPSAGVSPPGPTTAEPFAPEARYELKIDTDGDAVADRIPGAHRIIRRPGADCDAPPYGGR
ncbi:MAG TPA: DUF4331 family protein [Roseiarcus sp.]|nr:DUF4331 family protein [Roseiarcus sp.]